MKHLVHFYLWWKYHLTERLEKANKPFLMQQNILLYWGASSCSFALSKSATCCKE